LAVVVFTSKWSVLEEYVFIVMVKSLNKTEECSACKAYFFSYMIATNSQMIGTYRQA
jgi:hypothetical protein